MNDENDMNAAILAELKKMNESLSYIRAVAQRFNDQENSKAQSRKEMQARIPNFGDLTR